MNQLMPWDGEVVRMGWPWHGKIRQPDKDLAGYVTLPNGATRPAIAYYGTWPMNHTHLFDMGLPDQDDPQVEEQGGKWWGRTILRGGGNYDYQLYYGGATTSAEGQPYTGEAPFRGLPLWWDSDEEPRRPLYVDIYLNVEQGSYYLDFWTKGGTIHALWKKITLEDVGQGAGQPECAVKDLLGSNFDYWFFGENVKLDYLKLLGVYRNRLLLGVVVTQGEGMRQIDPPPGTSVVSGSSPSGAPQGLYGLVEVTIAPDIRDPEADHSQTVTIDVIENRQAALGNPVHQVTDESSQPGDPIETTLYREEWNQTSGLLTAWYDAQGNIHTARYNRRHYALKEYRNEPGVTTRTATERSSEVALLSGSGSVVDSTVLTEQFEALYIPGTGLQITRTVKCTGEPDDVTTYTDPDHTGGPVVTPPTTTFPPGMHIVNTVVTYQWLVNGENMLANQDQHQVWLAALSNNSAAICHIRDPFDYPEGQTTTTVSVRQGPAVRLGGVTSGTVTDTLTKSKPAHEYRRGFFWEPADRWVRASCNPITGELSRGPECIQYLTSWV
ncbi:hypothetical protein ACQYYA_00390 [Pseudomonas aeruginosa]|uniref:hypothetical protein n=2 Tax=Pseudomonas aeruginosa TaxID=287 RepID=UPI003D2A0256|nr:hypothetical protein [Pseudomonas aeruginosa]